MRLALIALIASSLIVPVGLAGTSADLLMKMEAPNKMVVEAKGTYTGQEASEWREQLDQNGDGTVSSEEVAAAEQMFKSFMGAEENDAEAANESIGSGFSVDGKGANNFEFADLDIQGAEGAVSSQSAWTVLLVMEIGFDVQAGDRHVIRIQGDLDDEGDDSTAREFLGEIESAKFRAASGYIFSDVQGLPAGAKLSGDKKEIDFGSSAGPSGEAVITMSKGGAGGSAPGLGVGLAVVVLALVGVAARRR